MKKSDQESPTRKKRSLRERVLRTASPLLAVAGLILLGFYAVGRETPELVVSKQKARSVPQPAPCLTIAEISPALTDRRVAVVGRLKTIDLPSPGSRAPYVLTLEEKNAELEVVFWSGVFEQMNQRLPVPGEQIYARGWVGLYKGRVQLNVRNAEDLVCTL